MGKQKLELAEVNSLPYEEFIKRFGGAVEHGALVAGAVWSRRPFTSIDKLCAAFMDFLDKLPIEGKEGVIRLYPDLAGHLAHSGSLTAESTQEHKAAGLDTLTSEERATMAELNERYKTKFGFPFVICARENKKEAIINGLEVRIGNHASAEVETGLGEVKKICDLRLRDIVTDSTPKL
ncbi:2-oxo-4-hydroxy-4-carboxy-5-ureidoimidazoline decarboxylase-like [Mya arenaria]|nr:2-oxo-4-hydroxy-4-carboxy-5-ureidoimidazoline decarboxylase-like [Mya arenaria]